MYLSDFLKNGATVQAKAGPSAIAANDILTQNILGAITSAKNFDYAASANNGNSPVGGIAAFSSSSDAVDQHTLQYSDGSIFIVESTSATLNMTMKKYSPLGTLLATVLLDGGATTLVSSGCRVLSNGNIAVFWAQSATPWNLYFAIVDQYLNIVVAQTLVQATSINPAPRPYMLALSGGGFVLTWTKAGTGVYYAIYSNAGAVVKAATAIAGTPAQTSGTTLGCHTSSCQLSNGNIAIALGDENTHALAFTITDAVGNSVVGYTAIGGASGGTVASNPQIQSITGFFCIAPGKACNAGALNAYVYSNAGVLQGTGYTAVGASAYTVIATDGTAFYAFFSVSGASSAVKLATNGTNTARALTTARVYFDGFYDPASGYLVMCDGTHADSFTFGADGAVMIAPLTSATVATVTSSGEFKNAGDYCCLLYNAGTFQVTKYADASVVGISAMTLAAGNGGTVISYAMGPGAYPCNPILGSQNKSFDHSGSNLIGNKGVMLGNAISLKGI